MKKIKGTLQGFIVSTALLFGSCAPTDDSKILIRDNMEVSPIEDKTNIAGTRILLNVPKSYTYNEVLKCYYKDDKQQVTFSELPKAKYLNMVKKVKETIKEAERYDPNVYTDKEFMLGEYRAHFSITQNGELEQIQLMFGDDSFVVVAIGYCVPEEVERKEMVDFMLSAYYDKSKKIDFTAEIPFQIGMNLHPFAINSYFGNVVTYTVGGGSAVDDPYQDQMLINASLIKMESIANNCQEIYSKLLQQFGASLGTELTIESQREFTEQNVKYQELIFSGYHDNTKIRGTIYIKTGSAGIVQFVGLDYKGSNRTEFFTKVIRSIDMKPNRI